MRRFYVVFALSPLCLLGNPTHPTVIQGTADFRINEKTLCVTPSQRAIINWQSFSIDTQEITHFIQPGIDAAVLNRVTGGHASELLGKLLANGRVYLINEKGIIFGKDSVIRVAEWIASTHDVLDEQFLNGDELLFKGNSTTQIVNLGTIQGASGNAVLIAHRIQNSGHLEAHGGDAACACGCEVLFKPKSAEPISILVKTSEETLPLLENNGTIQAFKEALNAQPEVLSPVNQGKVILTAQNGRIYLHSAGALLQEGQLTADTIVLNALNCDHSGTSTSSTLDIHCDHYIDSASSHLSANQIHIFAHDHLFSSGTDRAVGGSICLESQKIDLVGAHIDASGPSGGKILIGRGNNSMSMNAIELYVNPFSTIRSDGAKLGGQVVLWANDRTVFLGETSARGFYQNGTIKISTTPISSPTKNAAISLNSAVSLSDYPSFQFVDPNAGNGTGFGQQILPLSTGNVVVTKPGDNFAGSNSGAAYLYNGQTGALISSLCGSLPNDQVSNGGVTINNGNYVISSPNWNGNFGAVTWGNGSSGVSGAVSLSNSLVGSNVNDAVGSGGVTVLSKNYVVNSPRWNGGFGAVTWGNNSSGISGTVSSSNSLVGSQGGDQVGSSGVIALSNGNYVVISPNWDGGTGAVTWGSSSSGISGTVSSANSLVGLNENDQVGSSGITVLSNGNYVVISPNWNSGIGAVTWGSSSSGVSGAVSSSNSLVGSNENDHVGSYGITGFSNGNYLVISPNWNGGCSAVTWGSGSPGISGIVSSSNSLVGSQGGDRIGSYGIIALSDGNYVVKSPTWNGGVGAVTWGSSSSGMSGVVSASNSLVGSHAGDQIGFNNIIELSNGNYIVESPAWNGGVGAVTWGSGSSGVSGIISSSNSLIGSNADDQVGSGGITALSNGNYVVGSPTWNGGVGAVTWGNGSTGIRGIVSSSNSLVGSQEDDQIGSNGITALSNGNYAVASPNWNDGCGAVTWSKDSSGIVGAVSSLNSLVGSQEDDQIGSNGITALSNGNYVVDSPHWNGGVGAVTWGSGSFGISGAVSFLNSLVGSQRGDQIGSNGITALPNGNYVVNSPHWNDGLTNVGAVTWGNGSSGISGVVSFLNSLVGSQAGDQIGFNGIIALSNGNYIVISPTWNGGIGAVTWGSGSIGISGIVSSSNSLIGSQAGDQIGSNGITKLSNGNYIVKSPNWNGGVGAVTWGSGSLGVNGIVSLLNSLVGSDANDNVGSYGISELSNGNYVVDSPNWNGGPINGWGAVTWGNGSSGISGTLSSSNSLVGSQNSDHVGNVGIMLIDNGNYIVISPSWSNLTGAVTLGNAMIGISGFVNSINSVIGGSTSSGLNLVVIDDVNYTFISRFSSENTSGIIRVANDSSAPSEPSSSK